MSELARSIEHLAEAPVVCVGDLMLDRYVHGRVERISPEAPIPVIRVERETSMLGGAGNVVANLAALGARTRFASVVGDDDAGTRILRLLARDHGDTDQCRIIREPGRQTTVKIRYVANNQQLLRADSETIAPIAATTADALVADLRRALPAARALVLSDYGKGVLQPHVVGSAITAARAARVPVVVDPKGTDFSAYRGADVVTPNRRELGAAARMPVSSHTAVVAAAQRLIETCGFGAVVATLSEDGLSVVQADGTVTHVAAETREVFDVSGAGDTVVAVLAAALAGRVELVKAARLANVAAGIVIGKVGTAVVRASEITEALHAQEWRDREAKVLGLDEILERVARWRRRGFRVGFANGCFDLLHPGHIHLLDQAAAACDRLVVGLNSDQSVRRLKGERRPVQSESARATVLASLASVDAVTIFADDTPIALIEAIRPDVLVKGADYRIDQVVGGAFVQSYGGRVLLAGLAAGHSTTATIARMTG